MEKIKGFFHHSSKTAKNAIPLALIDPELLQIEQAVEMMRSSPAAYADGDAMAQACDMSLPQLEALCLRHFHATSEELLLRARLDHAKYLLLDGKAAISPVALASGFRTAAALKEAFVKRNGLGPEAYRALLSARSFEISLPAHYPLDLLHLALSRDPQSASELLSGDTYLLAHLLPDGPLLITVRFSGRTLRVTPSRSTRELPRVHAMLIGILGLEQDTEAWVRHARERGAERLVAARPELRVHQTPGLYDGLLWTLIGQQINLPFAFLLRRRLTLLKGEPVGHDLYAPPSPEAVATLSPADLAPLQYSRQKADYVISISRAITRGELDLEAFREMSATRAGYTLLAQRGLGPWSVNFLLMRSLGFADCLPLGDTGVTSSLQSYFELAERPGPEETLSLMAPFSPFRSLATVHLWHWSSGAARPEA